MEPRAVECCHETDDVDEKRDSLEIGVVAKVKNTTASWIIRPKQPHVEEFEVVGSTATYGRRR